MSTQISNLSFEPIVVHDIAQLVDLQPEGWRDIIPKFEDYNNQNFCFPIKLLEKNEIVAIGSVIIHQDVAWLGHIIVHPNHRKKGYGKLITQKLIEIATAKNCRSIQLIATDLGAPVYESIGFIEETEYLFFKEVSVPLSPIFNPYIVNFSDIYREQILAMDSDISGENRVCEIERHLSSSYAYVNDETVAGYYLPSLGEGLLIAANPIAGTALLEVHLRTNSSIVIPKENLSAVSFLLAHNCQPHARAKRMYLGQKIDVKFENIFNRIAGNIG